MRIRMLVILLAFLLVQTSAAPVAAHLEPRGPSTIRGSVDIHGTAVEDPIAYLVFGTGWPVLVLGTIWVWRRRVALPAPARTFLLTTLATFYVLGYTCTVYWLGQPWPIGVLPAFAAFLVLFIVAIRTVSRLERA